MTSPVAAATVPLAATLSPEISLRFQELPFVGMAMTSPASKRWIQVNQALCDMLGYTHAELLELAWTDVTHPADLGVDVGAFDEVMRGERDGYQLDKRFIRKDGGVLHATINVKAYRAEDGRVDYFIATIADITARVAAEAAARDAAALLTNLSLQVPGVIYQYQLLPDGRSRFPFASDAIADIYEVTPGEVRGDAAAVFARLHPDDYDRVAASITASAETLTPWRCTYRVVLPRRGLRWLSGHARPERLADGSTLWHGYITDSTETEQAREALAESEQRYRILVEHAPEAIVVLDVEAGRFIDANTNAERLLGWPRAALLQLGVDAISPPHQPDGQPSITAARSLVARALAGEAVHFEWTHRDAAGRDLPCEVHLTRLPFAGRQLVRGSMLDISERTRSREHLRRLQAAVECATSAIALADRDGRLTYVNPAFLALWGHAHADEVLGRSALSFWRSPEEAAAVVAALGHGTWSGELIAQRADGSVRTVAVTASAFTDDAGEAAGMLASFNDVTEARALAAQLVQSQKLESLGRLAGGIAHDFNNLLTVIKGYLAVALSAVADDDPVGDDLREVDRAADSAAALTRQLLAVSRRQVIAPVALDLNAVVRRIHGMLVRILGEDIALVLATAAELRPVCFDPAQAEQVLLNLAVNARDAMPHGGQLTIGTAEVRVEADDPRHPGLPPGEFVRLTVADTGGGMPPEVRDHVFEPFFTTKDVGKGSGLGLAMVHGAVAQNGGRIELESSPGRGTVFQIYLPVTAEPAAVQRDRRAAGLPRGHERVLLVEDDANVRGLARRLLEPLGYRVHDHGSPADALAWLAATDAPVDLLLTDVIMPTMNGRELADRVRALRPTIRVLFVSGYTADVIAHHGVLGPGVEFLAKPYTREALATRLRDLLDGPSPRG
ncbi:MAG: PAS domain S-box protein [Myxococcales bacterium]|nr:PAS domain S-box protein [Myxococcales bacterium]